MKNARWATKSIILVIGLLAPGARSLGAAEEVNPQPRLLDVAEVEKALDGNSAFTFKYNRGGHSRIASISRYEIVFKEELGSPKSDYSRYDYIENGHQKHLQEGWEKIRQIGLVDLDANGNDLVFLSTRSKEQDKGTIILHLINPETAQNTRWFTFELGGRNFSSFCNDYSDSVRREREYLSEIKNLEERENSDMEKRRQSNDQFKLVFALLAVAGVGLWLGKRGQSWASYVRDILESGIQFSTAALGSTAFFMILSQAVGFIPYSDRPGPGWRLSSHIPTMGEIEPFASWVIFSAIYFVPIGLLLRSGTRAVDRLGISRWFTVVGSFLAYGFLSGYLAAATGWYIAIAAQPIYICALAGGLFGAWSVFGITTDPPKSRPIILYVAGLVALASVLGSVYSLRSIVANSQQLDIYSFRIIPGAEKVDARGLHGFEGLAVLNEAESKLLDELGLEGHLSSLGMSGDGRVGSKHSAKVLLIFREIPNKTVELEEPENAFAIYVQNEKGTWDRYPNGVPVKQRMIRLVPHLDKDFLEIQDGASGSGISSGFIHDLKKAFQ